MAIYVFKGEEKLGPLNLKEIKQKLVKGEISEEDKALIDSIDEECVVKDIPGVFGATQGYQIANDFGLHRYSEEERLGYYDVEYASVWRRLVALILDGIIVGGLPSIIFAAMVFFGEDPMASNGLLWAVTVAGLLYFPLFEGSPLRGTVGKRLMNILVCDLQGQPLSWLRAFLRLAGRFASVLTLGLGYILPWLTNRRQTLHDLIARSIVINDD